MPVKDYRQDLLARLTNPDYAALYLKAALDEALNDRKWEAFGLALRNVAEAKDSGQEDAGTLETPMLPPSVMMDEPETLTVDTLLSVLKQAGLTIEFKPV